MNIDKAIKIGFYIVLCCVLAGLMAPISDRRRFAVLYNHEGNRRILAKDT